MAKPRVKVPSKVAKGEVFEVKSLISHTMESGQRKDRKTGETIPRMIINRFVARCSPPTGTRRSRPIPTWPSS